MQLYTDVAEQYRDFAAHAAAGYSPCFEEWAIRVAEDAEVLGWLEELPRPKRQPNLVFAAARWHGVDAPGPYDALRRALLDDEGDIRRTIMERATQTNEAGRCALLLPVLAAMPQPLALLEVGAAAGLGLYPDRYSYLYGDHRIGTGGPVLDCALTGTAPPTRLPEIVWRAGLDLNPLDVTDPEDLAWLEALVWPEQRTRRDRLRAAAAIAAADPPTLIRGDLVDDLAPLAAQAPAGATLVVFHTSVLYQVPVSRRVLFFETVRALPGHWLSVEAPDVVTFPGLPAPPDHALHNVVALDGRPLAWARGHGQAMEWLPAGAAGP